MPAKNPLANLSPQTKTALVVAVPAVAVFALLRKPAPAPVVEEDKGLAGWIPPTTDAIGTGQLAEFESSITGRLNALTSILDSLVNKPANPPPTGPAEPVGPLPPTTPTKPTGPVMPQPPVGQTPANNPNPSNTWAAHLATSIAAYGPPQLWLTGDAQASAPTPQPTAPSPYYLNPLRPARAAIGGQTRVNSPGETAEQIATRLRRNGAKTKNGEDITAAYIRAKTLGSDGKPKPPGFVYGYGTTINY